MWYYVYDGEDISIVVLRDIKVGKQLYLSYNECHDHDCEGMAHCNDSR